MARFVAICYRTIMKHSSSPSAQKRDGRLREWVRFADEATSSFLTVVIFDLVFSCATSNGRTTLSPRNLCGRHSDSATATYQNLRQTQSLEYFSSPQAFIALGYFRFQKSALNYHRLSDKWAFLIFLAASICLSSRSINDGNVRLYLVISR